MWQYEPPAPQGVCETARLLAAEQLRHELAFLLSPSARSSSARRYMVHG
jgi:hypothetical protein